MLTQRESPLLKVPALLSHITFPLIHQLQPNFLRLLHPNRKILHILKTFFFNSALNLPIASPLFAKAFVTPSLHQCLC
jgi:hypothetical protein